MINPERSIHLPGAFLAALALGACALHALAPQNAGIALTVASFGVTATYFVLAAAGRRGPAFGLAVLSVCVLAPELALRCAGYHFTTEKVIQFGFPTPQDMINLESDPELFWRLPAKMCNELGFLGSKVSIPKPAGTCRVVFLGDSCTQQGYSNFTRGELASADRARKYECVNMGVSGYSSYQGLVLARRWVERIEADVVVVYFGWNDHWLAYGATDVERAEHSQLPPPWLEALTRHSPTLQLLASQNAPAPIDRVRVPIDQYRANLLQIGELFRARGATVVFVTAPSSHHVLGVPDSLVQRGFAHTDEEVVALHGRYNEVVREIARDQGYVLADCARLADERADTERVFLSDGIHFKPYGLKWIGTEIAHVIQAAL